LRIAGAKLMHMNNRETFSHGGRDRGARGAMAPPIIWLGGHNVFAAPPIFTEKE